MPPRTNGVREQGVDCFPPRHSLHKDSVDEATCAALKAEYQKKSRDNARTPMQWDAGPQAGFTTGSDPWMRVNDNYVDINAAAQTSNPDSVYHTWRRVLEQRKAFKEIFVYGDFALVDEPNESVFAYRRQAADGQAALVVANFSAESLSWSWQGKARQVLVSPTSKTIEDVNGGEIRLRPCEAVALLL